MEDFVLNKIEELKLKYIGQELICGYDCSWGGRRKSVQAIGCLADVIHNFIREFHITTKYQEFKDIFKTVTVFPEDEASTLMEHTIFEKLVKSDTIQQAMTFVSDGDSKPGHVLSKEGVQCEQTKDENHTIKSYFASVKKRHDDLLKLFRYVFKDPELNVEEKIMKWQSFKRLFEKDEEKVREEVFNSFDTLTYLFRIIKPGIHTNYNEAFNALKSRLLEKDKAWKLGFIVRCFVSVLAYNHPDWKTLLRQFFKLDISNYDHVCKTRIANIEKRSKYDRERVQSLEFKEKEKEKLEEETKKKEEKKKNTEERKNKQNNEG